LGIILTEQVTQIANVTLDIAAVPNPDRTNVVVTPNLPASYQYRVNNSGSWLNWTAGADISSLLVDPATRRPLQLNNVINIRGVAPAEQILEPSSYVYTSLSLLPTLAVGTLVGLVAANPNEWWYMWYVAGSNTGGVNRDRLWPGKVLSPTWVIANYGPDYYVWVNLGIASPLDGTPLSGWRAIYQISAAAAPFQIVANYTSLYPNYRATTRVFDAIVSPSVTTKTVSMAN